MKHSYLTCFMHSIHNLLNNFYAVVSGLIVSMIGYFIPVHNIVMLLLVLFMLDVIIGYWSAKKVRGERFSVKIIWDHTIPRMLISIILILGSFMWDKVYEQNLVSTYKVIGWFISGVLLYSIAENGYRITSWSIFPKIGYLFKSKVKENTGMDIDETDIKK